MLSLGSKALSFVLMQQARILIDLPVTSSICLSSIIHHDFLLAAPLCCPLYLAAGLQPDWGLPGLKGS
jgi:hypothetical protein